VWCPTNTTPQGLAQKFARAKHELDVELAGFSREAQALTEVRGARRAQRSGPTTPG